MSRQAFLTMIVKNWTGWSREQPKPASLQLAVQVGHKLTPAIVGIKSLAYEITVNSVDAGQIVVAYHGVVVENGNGTINLTAPRTGLSNLKTGECLRLATPTMDGGTLIRLTLDRIE